MRRELVRTSAFARDLRTWLKSRPNSAPVIEAALDQLSADASHPLLRTHKLRGAWTGCWVSSLGYDLRVVFEYAQQDGVEVIHLLAMGTHDQVY